VILALGFIGCIVVVFFVPNAKGDEASERVGDEATMGD